MKKLSILVLLLGVAWVQGAMAQAVICGGGTANAGQEQDATLGTYAYRLTAIPSVFNANGLRQDVLQTGVLISDGCGDVHGRAISTSVLLSAHTWVVDWTWTGTYIHHNDETGFLSIVPATMNSCQDTSTVPATNVGGGCTLNSNANTSTGTENPRSFAFSFSETHLDGNVAMIELTEIGNNVANAKTYLTGQAHTQ